MSLQGKPARVLVVEDDHVVAMDIESALLDAGFDVIGVAATADDAIAIAQAEKPDLAIVDIRLAGHRDGVDAALDLFQRLGLRSIFATAHHDAATRLLAQPACPLGWLSKPYHVDMVVRAVRKALDDLSKP